ncbi:cytochrome P450 [Dichomitus squalens LYAD-421 SS1]|uniref:Cytochrome P450 n=1 Tax=Dichomitus squalens (strain LYAD-421) TaxID=732165 RepID=R7SPS8_DICSQ|nr:cytochrome P450 [Dichomitus squalens LYAD-421 SS1]EJF57953.1 cytochrome P450 [Dichomitus squalens LYAD-421 SS1]
MTMYPLGFLPLFCTFLPYSVAVNAALLVPVIVLAVWSYAVFAPRPSSAKDADDVYPVHLPGSSLAHILPFFQRRFDFINQGFELAGQAIYQFSLLRKSVIVLSGEAARRDFFQAKDLDLGAGFRFLSGAVRSRNTFCCRTPSSSSRDRSQLTLTVPSLQIPMLPGVTTDLGPGRVALIYKRLATTQTSESLSRLIPQILEDSRRTINAWGNSGILDPFDRVPELIFQTSVRSLAFSELAEDPATVKRLRELYDTLDTATTPATVLFPWLPSPTAVRKLLATKRIYDIIGKTLDDRMKNGIARDDTPQMLIDAGDERMIIIGFVMGLLVAGARSTGTTASWLITFLSGHPEWREKAADEVRRLIMNHAAQLRCSSEPRTTFAGSTEDASCSAQDQPERQSHQPPSSAPAEPSPASPPLSSLTASLASIPLSAWENDTPVLDSLIRETLRVAEPHVAMRQYLPLSHSSEKEVRAPHAYGKTLYLGGRAIPPGAYVMYPFSDVHLSSDVYQNPWRWDPGRAEMGLKAPYSYVGMGAGTTICQGKRLATLELKLVTAQVVLGFGELRAVDARGLPLPELPRPNWNDVLTCKPPPGSCYVRFERTVEVDAL